MTTPTMNIPDTSVVFHRPYTVVSHAGTEYFVTKVNPKKLKVMAAKDGRLLEGDKRAFTFVRAMNEQDHETMRGHENFRTTLSPEVSTEKFGLGNHVVLKEGVKPAGGIAVGTEYVVIGINAKSVSIVPDGGFGNGQQYIRFTPGALEIVKANNNQG